MHHIIARILMFALMSIISGCAIPNVPHRNIVMFNEYGRLLDPTGNVGCEQPPALCNGRHLTIIPYDELSQSNREKYLDDLFANVIDNAPVIDGKKRLFIFAHGGLNTQKASVESATNLFDRMNQEKRYSPLFINWRSSLVSSYLDHAIFIRQGEHSSILGPLTSPVVIAVDGVRSVVRAPLVWGAQIRGGASTSPGNDWPYGLEDRVDYLESVYKREMTSRGLDHHDAIEIETGVDRRTFPDKALSGVSWFVLLPIRFFVAAPLIDGLGTSSWDNMLRRTKYLFHNEGEFKNGHPEQTGGDLSMVLRRLEAKMHDSRDQWEIVLVGHSMGTIVFNELLRQFPRLEVSTIVYLAAACSIRDFEASVIPYLQRHPATQFYNVTLHHLAEERERWDLLIPYFDPAMRGSLLSWIDDFFSNPLTPMDKTLGKSVNFLRTEHLIPPDVRGRVHLKEFSVGGDAVGNQPQEHGDFKSFPMWDSDFYTPRLHRN